MRKELGARGKFDIFLDSGSKNFDMRSRCTKGSRMSGYFRVCTGFGEYCKVMEVENAILQDLESFGKEIFKVVVESFGFCLEKF